MKHMGQSKIVQNKYFISALTAILVALTFYVFVIDCARRELLDFSVYLEAAKALLRGDNIYAQPYTALDRWNRSVQLYYLYPPLLAHVLSKFLTLDLTILKFSWCLLSFLCLVASAYCI